MQAAEAGIDLSKVDIDSLISPQERQNIMDSILNPPSSRSASSGMLMPPKLAVSKDANEELMYMQQSINYHGLQP